MDQKLDQVVLNLISIFWRLDQWASCLIIWPSSWKLDQVATWIWLFLGIRNRGQILFLVGKRCQEANFIQKLRSVSCDHLIQFLEIEIKFTLWLQHLIGTICLAPCPICVTPQVGSDNPPCIIQQISPAHLIKHIEVTAEITIVHQARSFTNDGNLSNTDQPATFWTEKARTWQMCGSHGSLRLAMHRAACKLFVLNNHLGLTFQCAYLALLGTRVQNDVAKICVPSHAGDGEFPSSSNIHKLYHHLY
jgi:hypothetical protein